MGTSALMPGKVMQRKGTSRSVGIQMTKEEKKMGKNFTKCGMNEDKKQF